MTLLAGYVVKVGGGSETQCPATPDAWRGVGFSLSNASTIQSVEIYHSQYDAPPQDDPGVANVVIRAVDGSYLPILPNLVAKTVATLSCPLVAGVWFGNVVYKASVTFDTPLSLPAGNYALLLDTVVGGYGDRIDWWTKFASGMTWWTAVANVSKNYRYSLSSNDGGVNWAENPSFEFMFKINGTETVAPTVTSDPASGVSAIAATLNGTLDDDGGEACDCGFEWGETVGYGNTTPTQSRTTGQTFAQAISGLSPGTTYHFRAFATNSVGTAYGADTTFTTLVAIPTVTTDPATSIALTSATLNGSLDDDGGEACECGFEWGETDAYGNTTPTESKATGESFSQPLTGLSSDTTYHFRAFATNSVGTAYGADTTFSSLFDCPYCADTFATEEERDAHIASVHASSSISKAHALSREEL